MNKIEVINFIVNFLMILKSLIVYAIIGRVLMSWFTFGQGGQRGGAIAGFLYSVTDPFINLAKRIPHQIGTIDLSPIITIFALDLIGQLLVTLLAKLV